MILVSRGSEFAVALGYHLKPLGFALEHHTDPSGDRAAGRIQPAGNPLPRGRFSRHWKPLLMLARERKPREELIFLLIAPLTSR